MRRLLLAILLVITSFSEYAELVYENQSDWLAARVRGMTPGTYLPPHLELVADHPHPQMLRSLGSGLPSAGFGALLTLELFQVGDDLLANEMAPRVHNSGHWTIEGAFTSQFENHVRAVCGWPLGRCDAVNYSAMFNFIGTVPPTPDVLRHPAAHLHTYGKAPRPGRKVASRIRRCSASALRPCSAARRFSASTTSSGTSRTRSCGMVQPHLLLSYDSNPSLVQRDARVARPPLRH